ncbi:hypothetical protein [Paraglaciecola polaris]|uniref:Uncharacterized protein n=1 Tax=Paraglaciecola polaris LMG 21857 TaxID=1129793 RepID=K6YEL7_9ALTE|nr:hypothetical protein [Paraglaciecola polaris]GAC31184.1 hypothetical protein GPLA_0265 [Paraglaciecola polaris LMG 21857]|tara:strand:+ start:470 stop:652 length:183 start_codon:yes stop_codon:yes gene_type:complete
MSCLTRKLQQQLTRYIQRNSNALAADDAEQIRNALVSKGVCPSDVTTDQVKVILQGVRSS